MYKLLVRLLLIGLIVQTFIVFVGGPSIGIQVANVNVNILEIVFFISLLIVILTLPIEFKNHLYGKLKAKNLYSLFLLLLFIPIFLWGVYKGFVFGYPAVFTYSIGVFFVIFSILLSYLAGFSEIEIKRWIKIISRFFLVLAVISIPFLFLSRFFNFSSPFVLDYYGYPVWFMISFGFLYTFVMVFVNKSSSIVEKVGFFIFFLAELIGFEKKILASLLVSILTTVFLYWINGRKFGVPSSSKLTKVFSTILITLILIVLLLIAGEVTSIGGFYTNFWEDRVLHLNSYGEIDLLGGRSEVWRITLQMITQRPWDGYGVGIRVENSSLYAENKPYLSTHNTYLHFILALGLPGGVIVILNLINIMKNLTKSIGRCRPANFPLIVVLFSYIVGFIFMSFFDTFTIAQSGYVLFGLLVGFTLSLGEQKPNSIIRNNSAILFSRSNAKG